mmetsp:Transcript_22530/g.47138  ORF Transcript_22530/g.47138 Transcript_22530/m.47138 type:complete len:338 (-) Transcript_22530:67-1080(-)
MCIANSNNAYQFLNGKCNSSSRNNETTANNSSHTIMIFPRVRRFLPVIISGYIFNTALYFLLHILLPYTGINTTATSEFCKSKSDESTVDDECTRVDLFAFQIVSFVNLFYLGVLGFHTFFVSRRAFTALPQKPLGRILGNVQSPNSANGKNGAMLPEADYVNIGIIIFQGWDFIASIFFDEHCTAVMMTHHFLAFICGLFSLEYGLVPFYATYFGGVSEFSSIFLCVADLFRYFPPSSFQTSSPSVVNFLSSLELGAQGMFVLTFFNFRILGWIYLSSLLFKDAVQALKRGLMQQYCPGSRWFLLYLLSMSILLGGLQAFWFRQIIEKAVEVVAGN